ncbi:MarR family winged helix-turn-helix transcriptional regulator [Saccharopolyspora rosea]|uniref:MarR family winged helix-turn-helix transcriptional regulator n=1 Tax=Saccharopolyspora rosea TaxID=524884 RepID=A0ABW3FM83_9PSEU
MSEIPEREQSAEARSDVERLTLSLVRISDRMRRARSRVVDPARVAVLQAAATQAEVRPSEIANRLTVHQSSVSRQVRALEADGLVSLARDPADGRSCLISLTEAGRAEAERLTRLGVDAMDRFVADWPEEDVRSLADLLERLEESIEDIKALAHRKATGRPWQRRAEAPS